MDTPKGNVYLTKERLHELENELNELKTTGRKEVAEKISDARAHGDLTENSEYDAAKLEQEALEMKIGKLEEMLAHVKIIAPNDLPNDKIYILHNVKLLNLKSNEEFTYKLVSQEEADLDQNKISVTSPMGKALLGKKIDEEIEINAPVGIMKFRIIDIFK